MNEYSMDEIKKMIRSIAISRPGKVLTVKNLANDFKDMEGFEIPYKQMGFRSIDQFLHSLTDVVKVIGYGPTAQVEPIVIDSNKHIHKLVQGGKHNVKKNRFKNSNSTYNYSANTYNPNENMNNASRSTYYSSYNYKDNIRSDKDDSNSEDSLPKFTMNQNKQLITVNGNETRNVHTANNTRNSEAIPGDAAFDLLNGFDVPSEAVAKGELIKTGRLSNTIRPNDSVFVFVTDVHSPHRLWFHLLDNAEKLDELMSEIEAFYTPMDPDQWRMKPSNVGAGSYCVANLFGIWHRAMFVSECDESVVKVFLIDYGTVANIDLKDIKYMAKCFAGLPAQALRASLALVKPISKNWTRDTAMSLLSMVHEKVLYAHIVNINQNDGSCQVVLIDTNGPEDIIINKHLAMKGNAVWGS